MNFLSTHYIDKQKRLLRVLKQHFLRLHARACELNSEAHHLVRRALQLPCHTQLLVLTPTLQAPNFRQSEFPNRLSDKSLLLRALPRFSAQYSRPFAARPPFAHLALFLPVLLGVHCLPSMQCVPTLAPVWPEASCAWSLGPSTLRSKPQGEGLPAPTRAGPLARDDRAVAP